MRQDLRPYWLKRLYLRFRHWYTQHFIAPRCAHLGPHATVMKPWYVSVSGPNITIGSCFTAIGEPDRRVQIHVWGREPGEGQIRIGDGVLLSPGVRLSASDEILIGDGCMLASGCYVTDSDWHDVYDRTSRPGAVTPVHLGRNVWVGDGATILKGVSVGDNSVIAAGAVVTRDVPANAVAAGNPARVVKSLDHERELRTRLEYFSDPEGVEAFFDAVDRQQLSGNTFLGWLRDCIAPRRQRSGHGE